MTSHSLPSERNSTDTNVGIVHSSIQANTSVTIYGHRSQLSIQCLGIPRLPPPEAALSVGQNIQCLGQHKLLAEAMLYTSQHTPTLLEPR